MRLALVGIGILAIALTWSASTLFLVALASRAFALYYFLQCLVAYHVATKTSHRVGIALVAALLGFVVIFAKPVG
jgi:hypothetical protein